MDNFIIRKNWIYIKFSKWIYINIENPFKTMNKVKKIFKPLKCYFSFNRWDLGWYNKVYPIHIIMYDVGWKDKYDTPRYESPPFIWIHLFGLNLTWRWNLPPHQINDINDYWEQILWYLHYYHTYSQGLLDSPNIEKARQNWPWMDCNTEKSTWTDKFLIK